MRMYADNSSEMHSFPPKILQINKSKLNWLLGKFCKRTVATCAFTILISTKAWGVGSYSPICPSNTVIEDFGFYMDGMYDLPDDPNCDPNWGGPCPHYSNNINWGAYILSNECTDLITVQIRQIDLEGDYDFLCGGGQITQVCYSGNYPWISDNNPEDLRVQAMRSDSPRGILHFRTDSSNTTRRGVRIEGAKLAQTGPRDPAWVNKLVDRKTHIGFLQGTSDGMVLKMNGPTNGNHLAVTLDGVWQANNDFDIYARCGSVPTPDVYELASTGPNAREYLDINFCQNGTIYFLVVSYRGKGTFKLVPYRHFASAHRTLTVSDNLRDLYYRYLPDLRGTWGPQLQNTARLIFGATEGNLIIDRIDLYHGQGGCLDGCNGQVCDFCIGAVGGVGQSSLCFGSSKPSSNIMDGTTGLYDVDVTRAAAHEILHYYYCVDDEYVNVDKWQCGHSMMADHTRPTQNNLCSHFNHNTDGTPGWPPVPRLSAQEVAYSQGLSFAAPSSMTPDNSHYYQHPFNNQVATAVYK